MLTIKTKIELPIAHCLNKAYTGLCCGNVGRNSNKCFDLGSGLLPVIHGHNYVVTVELTIPEESMNADGMVVDFKLMKKIIHEHLDMYDHSMILTPENPLTEIYIQNYKEHGINMDETRIFIWCQNPTAEFMAQKWRKELWQKLGQLFPNKEHKVAVTVEETSNNSVTCYE